MYNLKAMQEKYTIHKGVIFQDLRRLSVRVFTVKSVTSGKKVAGRIFRISNYS
jgi:hypothetical protein